MPRDNRTSIKHTLRHWTFQVVDADLYSLPNKKFTDGSVQQSFDDVVVAVCGWCKTPAVVLDPNEWWAGRRIYRNHLGNRHFVGRSCMYCFKVCQIPDKATYDEIVRAGRST